MKPRDQPGDHRDPEVLCALLNSRLFSSKNYEQEQENIKLEDENVEPRKEPKATRNDKPPHALEGIVVPLICHVCSKNGHLSNCLIYRKNALRMILIRVSQGHHSLFFHQIVEK